MLRTLYFSAVLVVILSLSACISSIRSDVVAFHEGNLPMGETIQVVPMDDEKQGSLEFEHYANLVRENLGALGYTPVSGGPEEESATLIAEIDYSVSDARVLSKSESKSPYVKYHFYYGRHGHPYYYGFRTEWPREIYNYAIYDRALRMNIVRAQSEGDSTEAEPIEREVLFEGRVQSTGKENDMAKIVPYLITAMFENFPGESGVTKVVTIEGHL